MNKTLIEISNLYFAYDKSDVLEDVNLTIGEGDFLALVGPNGGGKTTLLKLISGLLAPDQGEVRIRGQSLQGPLGGLGYVPQNTCPNRTFPISVYDVVLMGRLDTNRFGRLCYTRGDRELAMTLLEQMGILKYRHQRMDSLSGGQQQRALIARALLAQPQILILDEPAASLDIQGKADLYALLKQVSRNVAIVMSSHDIKTVGEYIKSMAWVNRRVKIHDTTHVTVDMLEGAFQECGQFLRA